MDRPARRARPAASTLAAPESLAAARDRVLAGDARCRSCSFPDYLVLRKPDRHHRRCSRSRSISSLGYAGIVSLGHAAFFGIGAYTGRARRQGGWGEPVSGLVLGRGGRRPGRATRRASIISALPPPRADHGHARPRPPAARDSPTSAHWLTGGADGLQGVKMWPLLGTLPVRPLRLHRLRLFAGGARSSRFLVVRRVVNSPFGLSLQCGIRENPTRMPGARGAEPRAHPQPICTISPRSAGVAGALLAQTTETVSARHARASSARRTMLVILILGGAGRLYGRPGRRDHLHGRARPVFRPQSPVLVLLDRRAPRPGRDGAAQRGRGQARPAGRTLDARRSAGTSAVGGRAVVSVSALSTRGLDKRFGSSWSPGTWSCHLPRGARHALHRPERRRQDHADQPRSPACCAPDAGRDHISASRGDHRLEPDQRVKPRLARTFQINACFPGSDALEATTLAVCERSEARRRAGGARCVACRAADRRGVRDPSRRSRLAAVLPPAHPRAALRPAAAPRDRTRARHRAERCSLLDEPAAGVPRDESCELFARHRQPVRGTSRCCFIEHDMDVVFRFASRIIVMVGGRILRRRHAGGDRRPIRACARSISARGRRSWLSRCSRSGTCAPATARRWCWTASRSTVPERGSVAGAGTQRRRQVRRCFSPSWATPTSAAARSLARGATSPAGPPHRPRACRGVLGWVRAGARGLSLAHRRGEPQRGFAARARSVEPPGGIRPVSPAGRPAPRPGRHLSGGEQQMPAIARAR